MYEKGSCRRLLLFNFQKHVLKCHFARELAKESEGGNFDTDAGRSKTENGQEIKCSAVLRSNEDIFEGDSADGAFVEKETRGGVVTSQVDKIPGFVVRIVEKVVDVPAAQGEKATQSP